MNASDIEKLGVKAYINEDLGIVAVGDAGVRDNNAEEAQNHGTCRMRCG